LDQRGPFDTELGCDLVGGTETDAADAARQAVGAGATHEKLQAENVDGKYNLKFSRILGRTMRFSAIKRFGVELICCGDLMR
jgi:hypothetical protein